MTTKRVIWSPSKTPCNLPSHRTHSKSIIHKISRRHLLLSRYPDMSVDRYLSSSATFKSLNAGNTCTFRRDLPSAVLQLQRGYLCFSLNVQFFHTKITQKQSEHICRSTVITNGRNSLYLPRFSGWWWWFSVESHKSQCWSLRCWNAVIWNSDRDRWRQNW